MSRFYLRSDQNKPPYGPFTAAEILDLARKGMARASDQISTDGSRWQPLAGVKGIRFGLPAETEVVTGSTRRPARAMPSHLRHVLQSRGPRLVFLVFLVLVAWWLYQTYYAQTAMLALHPPGVVVSHEPMQYPGHQPTWREGDYTYESLADFQISALVLGARRYRLDREAALAPVDLALGWGRMSDPAVVDRLRITQRGRFYFWSTRDMPMPLGEIERSSANMHMIPATQEIRRELLAIRRGDVVHLAGRLVRVRSDDGWQWVSSTSREDTGAGACEVIWVEALRRVAPSPRE